MLSASGFAQSIKAPFGAVKSSSAKPGLAGLTADSWYLFKPPTNSISRWLGLDRTHLERLCLMPC